MIKKILSCLIALLVLLEHTTIPAAAYYKINKKKPVQILTETQRKRQAIVTLCKDDYIADVLANSSYPYTLTAIAKVESDFKPNIRGDHGKSYGLFQIQERYWGYVPRTVEGQARAAEKVLGTLITEYGYAAAIKRYNGSGRDAERYRHKVLLVINQLQQIERSI